jgi:hypothetical protein
VIGSVPVHVPGVELRISLMAVCPLMTGGAVFAGAV